MRRLSTEKVISIDKAGEGIYFKSNMSNFHHKISAEIMGATKSKRAVIVFFRDGSKLNEFVASPTYRQLGRHKSLLKEDMSSIEKDYVISKAATAGQITLSTAVFGRGTDFFCKDEGVEKSGGVHIIQVSVIFGVGTGVDAYFNTWAIFCSLFYSGFVNAINVMPRHFCWRK